MKATITASIQYWLRVARRGSPPVDERPVVGERQAEHVAADQRADLDVPDELELSSEKSMPTSAVPKRSVFAVPSGSESR